MDSENSELFPRLCQRIMMKEEGKELSSWLDLPAEILELIIQRLCITEYLRLCQELLLSRSNHKVGTFSPRYTNWDYCAGSVDGWLILVNKNYFLNSVSGSRVDNYFLNPVSGSLVDNHFLNLVSGSLVDNFLNPVSGSLVDNYFLNPVSGSRVMLPPQTTIPSVFSYKPKFFKKIVASSPPDCPDCIVAGVPIHGLHLGFCRIHDEAWSFIKTWKVISAIEDIELHDQRLYAITMEYTLTSILVIDLSNPSAPRTEKLSVHHSGPDRSTEISFKTRHIVKDSTSGGLFLIYRILESTCQYNQPREIGFRVFKLDMHVGPQWVEVDSLRDHLLFLSNKGSRLIPSNILNGPEEMIRENCIYFSFRLKSNKGAQCTIGSFCMIDMSIAYFSLSESDLSLEDLRDTVWFMPKLW
ncbi:F-box protein [Quillaja saponaria]|uniref:F-box protein n=1 Tax=Quillaja saponaria TaxID=32244 RepID=A0AAD7QH21_QUISA|nr:F-box protein [Quillaja saponaria]